MFISGDRDDLVPSFHMKKLYEGAVKSAFRYMYSVVGGTHNDTWAKAGRKYYLVRPSLACSIPITGISISFCVMIL
jgi:fermentation-respiration switch protein FrsA (DUF1100 family)